MKIYSVTASKSEDSMGNTIEFYKENGLVWVGYKNSEEKGFTVDEVNELIEKLKRCMAESN